MPKAFRFVMALTVSVALFAAVIALAAVARSPSVALAQGSAAYHTLRVYGRANEGAGDLDEPDVNGVVAASVHDISTTLHPEDAPYTNPEAIFNPQLDQAPIKDSVTWNPLFMSEFETRDENQALYGKIFAGPSNATEKVWFRLWYEPWHWDKDLNHNGALDITTTASSILPSTTAADDEWYPAVMQEFTYMLLEPEHLIDEPAPLAGNVGQTSFVFPVGMRKSDLFAGGLVPAVDSTSANAVYGHGLTSLDADFDGVADIVNVESELTLFSKTGIAADFDGNGYIDPLDLNGDDLSGDELAVLRIDGKSLAVNQAIQFLDHMLIVKQVSDTSVQVEIWYLGDKIPYLLDQQTLYVKDMLLSGRMAPSDHIRAVVNGGPGTNMCDFPTGPWFAYLESIDQAENKARIWVGRGVGKPYSGMEDSSGGQDLRPGDPWFLKRFYVDGHEYNVVAMKTENTGGASQYGYQICPIPVSPSIPSDPGQFKFITIRTPVPKVGSYSHPVDGYRIEQHSVRLQAYGLEEYLSVMPPYNYEHYILMDVQAINGWSCDERVVPYFGTLVGPVPPILQGSGPFPYTVAGTSRSYSNRREMALFYVGETPNPQFLGELKQMYGEGPAQATPMPEFWYVEQFHTLPWEFTEFVLPDLSTAYTGNQGDLYLLTSQFQADESQAVLWTQNVQTQTMMSDQSGLYHVWWHTNDNCWFSDTVAVYEGVPAPEPVEDMMPDDWRPRAKLWFDPGVGGKKYKDAQGLRVYGRGMEVNGQTGQLFRYGAGDPNVTDPSGYPVEVFPYTDAWAPFNPQLDQAPEKDSLTLNPAYMDKSDNNGEALVALYNQISIREHDAREKVFWRMWYEPLYLDKILRTDTDPRAEFTVPQVYSFPAVMQEFTYMYLDTADQPAHAQPGSSSFAFPVATSSTELPAPDAATRELPASRLPSFGYGLTTFDPDFDGQPDAVRVHSEGTLSKTTNITASFDGDSTIDDLANAHLLASGNPGTAMVIFTTPEKTLRKGQSLQFLDYMVTLENVSSGQAELKFWYAGGGVHAVSGGYSLHPDAIGTRSMVKDSMAILGASRSSIRVLPPKGDNLGSVDGPWFAFVKDVNSSPSGESVTLVVGRALGAAHSAMDKGDGTHDMTPGDPWYLKRFFVDGHEYNVVVVHVVDATIDNPGDEDHDFKFITIRTPVPKPVPPPVFVNTEDSQALQGYYVGTVFGVNTGVISVMPPFNAAHTMVEDITALPLTGVPPTGCVGELEQFVFGNPKFYSGYADCPPSTRQPTCTGQLKAHTPYVITIVDEGREQQFFGELKEKYFESNGDELWQTEQWHTLPDQYTDLRLPPGQKYLLTSNWRSAESRVAYYGCDAAFDAQDVLDRLADGVHPVPETLSATNQSFYRADVDNPLRVKFLYDPADPGLSKDIYVNTWPTASGSIQGVVKLQGRTNFGGATVSCGWGSTTTDSLGRYTLTGVPVGTYTVTASMHGYLKALKGGVVVLGAGTTTVPDVRLLGGDADNDCNIDLFDLVAVSSLYGGTPPAGSGVDINGNGVVDIFDLVMVGVNFDKACPGVWAPAPALAPALAAPAAYLRAAPAYQRVEVGQEFAVELKLDGVNNLYGVDARLTFDPRVLEVVDANPGVEGVQIQRGSFPNPASGNVPKAVADNQAGLAWYAITLVDNPVNPVPAASGSGTLCTIRFRAKANGYSGLKFAAGTLVNRGIESTPVKFLEGSVGVGRSYRIHLPIHQKLASLR